MFPPISYLEWMQGRPAVAVHDLGSSDLRGDRGFEPEVVPGPLAELPDPPAGVSLETLVATEYGVHPERVVAAAGASHANFTAMAAAVGGFEADREDDARPRVLVEAPGYEPLVRTPVGLGATVDRFRRPADEEYRLDPDRVAGALTPETCLVVVTNRHNPSGRLADRSTLAEVAAVAREAGATLLVDEVYAPYVPAEETREDGAFGGPTAAGLDGAVVTGSLTKFFGLGDLRAGWLVADREFAGAARTVAAHLPVVAGPSRALGARALYAGEDLAADRRALLDDNAPLLAEFVEVRADVSGYVAPGSTFALLACDGVDGDELASAAGEAGVLVVPGRFFGEPGSVRVSLGGRPEAMDAALSALAGAMELLG